MRNMHIPRRELVALPRIRISRVQFDALGEYSASNPTGVYVGKLWRCQLAGGAWVVRGYVEVEDPTKAAIWTWRPFFTALPAPNVVASLARYELEVERSFHPERFAAVNPAKP